MFSTILTQDSPQIIITAILTGLIDYAPRFFASILILILGRIVANYMASTVTKIIAGVDFKKLIDSFELGITLPPTSQRGLTRALGLLVRYMILYLTFIWVFDLLGLTGIALFLRSLAGALPRIISSIFIIILGVIVAGLIESLIKKTFVEIDPATARLSGKVASYVVITFFVLMSLAELGLASFFINTLFVGFVASLSIALGLSLGLGSKDIVNQTLGMWYKSKSKQKK
jgi:hypothetical protein